MPNTTHTLRETTIKGPRKIDLGVVDRRHDFRVEHVATGSSQCLNRLRIGRTAGSANAAWQAILIRDRCADGTFVYAVHSTGLYCRPSCPARHPLRQNTVLYPTAEGAERDGYSACSRCSPGSGSETLAETCVRAVITLLEVRVRQAVTVKALSQLTRLSASHLQHTFKQVTGLTPKGYHDSRRIEGFKERLRRGESIVSAAYGMGYGSSRALYERVGKNLGMTPSVYQRGGSIPIRFGFVASSRGPVLIAVTSKGLCALLRGSKPGRMLHELRGEFPKATFARAVPPPADWIAAVRSGDSGDPLVAKLPLATRDRLFRARVSLAMRQMTPA